MPSNKPKMIFVIEEALTKRLDQYRADLFQIEGKIPSRAEAIRRLIDEGLSKHEKKGKK